MTNSINQRLFLDIHAIQTVPPSNINRDDTGSPKTAQYGGVTRARVSSQSWKRAIRKYFYDKGDTQNIGIRSCDIVKYIAKKIVDKDNSISVEDAITLVEKTLNAAKLSTKDQKLKALFFISNNQADKFAQACLDKKTDKTELQEILKTDTSIDIALFGRMLADDPSLNEDASSQVAHAISTHAIESEFDFYTAVDDLAPEDNAGAGMLGTLEYDSSTLYRYANIALHDFYKQLGDKEEVIDAVKLFVEAFVKSMPTGKINSFANQTLPQAVVVSLRSDRPINLVSAFEEPVKSENGYVDKSIQKLFAEYVKYEKILDKPIFTDYLLLDDTLEVKSIGKSTQNLDELLSDLKESINVNL
ncbi:type I-E CRISPR-associated protein Cas7/Cse4/CasC [Lactobacillus iners]|jgi:CRISPR system CASCADE complex protein casC|uniref:Type I-E CRISPR-associated protein Cas7/Cse4/CasC n=1 Tax=Lactobacillus iners TaxID=147802 RepID=A0A6G7B7Y2_9LACO|nr:type I-E CRISPR-associated protein Cas7/Cse4/CasC [Lactobacillus iners]EFQ47732.1 CRISPR system CASCADE complex protein CasC [Lactobacillus iners LEAF 2053A-b]MCT7685631.1 type I-E CRISPR-associated protein Cas7/Cse4/CasC [Lactobacillus iners]MCT7725512.1 type I-E CRISPR-associated protein Cas7/Cse4/CasC [Lactobacillus iners]MCT7746796.1 type I-E CRISPR-associated protein Cas7/Cse4/CasC [Lactobacillus iners]MCT7826834.1 type I-E CRISPR-associated protein Cas7/Cse4/CasC [Lactobacillus iners]